MTLATVLFAAIGILGSFWLVSEYKHHLVALNSVHDDAIAARKSEVKALINDLVERIEYKKSGVEAQLEAKLSHYTEIGLQIVNGIYQESKGKLPEKEIKRLIIATLMPMRFLDGRGYFWIHTTDYTLIAHPFRQQSIGINDADLTDSKGQKLICSFVLAAKTAQEGGFVTYYSNKPRVHEKYHLDEGQKKIAHLRLFEPFNWVIGMGEYVKDSDEELKREIVKGIASIRHGPKGYIFTNTRDGVCLNHIKKEHIGKNRWDLQDVNGVRVIQELDRAGRQPGGGFLEYVGTIDPETDKPAKKVSYVQAVEDWGWVIGSGVYLTDIQKKMLESRQKLISELRKKITTTILLLVGVLIIGFLIGRQLFQGFLKELNLFVTESSGDKMEPIDLNQFRITEMYIIAHRANVLLKEKKQTDHQLQQAQKMEAIGTLAGGIAHDFNNILAAIIGYTELARDEVSEGSTISLDLDKVLLAGDRAKKLIFQILTFSRQAESEQIFLQPQLVLKEAISLLRSSIPATITIKQDIEDECGRIKADPTQLHQVIMNLCTNSYHAMEETGGTLTIGLKRKKMAAKDLQDEPSLIPGAYVQLIVRDTGPGIDPAVRKRIFDPFFTTKEVGKGTGMGLAMVHGIVKNHGGMICCESEIGHGTTFKVFFPETIEITEKIPETDTNISTGPERILFVDDEAPQADIGKRLFERLGYSVTAITDSRKALDVFKSHPNQFDLIITDQTMPGMNGSDLAGEILAIQPGIPVILCTGYSSIISKEEALAMGIRAFIMKPMTKKDIAPLIRKVLDAEKA